MAEEQEQAGTETETTETDVKDWKAEAEKWQVLARKNEDRAKSNAGAAKELEKVRAAAMSEQERAVAEAKTAGQTEASRAAAPRLVRAELRAEAVEAGLAKEALDGFLEYADLSKFVGDDGEPDSKAIAAAVKRLGGGKATNFDGGPRTTAAKPADMNALIRQAAGLG
ncbi:hypothetical protein GCM10010435_44290 [Winogradskya consettensis]|uniref:Scaffolding protein n=1 Tax=Winogradskya consettensis TaxID=113560 RepID=A0A919T0G1_9ACTN|nr:hypothetical protein [Actinoplanes consettensis]GIM82670.1 hypothetical protein Aco04nite_82680 [Actinoplanes consettensis]